MLAAWGLNSLGLSGEYSLYLAYCIVSWIKYLPADVYLIIRVLESIKAGCRLPEAKFASVLLASKKQRSVLDFMIK